MALAPDGRTRRRGRRPPPPGAASPPGFAGVRFVGAPGEGFGAFFGDRLVSPQPGAGPLRILALSGGGAGGAFGAGALVGLSRAKARPHFDIVTGVSTGALIAPLALLGEAWDDRLRDAYAGGAAQQALALTQLRPGPSLYARDALVGLVRRYVDEALIAAVGEAHDAGRGLFVATSNLDSQTTSVWDLGAVAARGGPAALELFTDVLIASASLPGVFPPRLIPVECDGELYEEMHVDGGAVSPIFVVPESLLLQRAAELQARGAEVYALVNTTLRPEPRATPLGAVPILMRSFELMLRSSYRSALRSVAAFCELNGFTLYAAAMPPEFSGVSMLRFERTFMAGIFDAAVGVAEQGRLWSADLAA
ncbi:patatin-like phospholipase family protein [Phenylobacterium sp.]|uniref:patatin-like phospholipase family protein n=1 Tax=Phenylobacterium sp. TaxID=1871053 RepID=UPI0035B16826